MRFCIVFRILCRHSQFPLSFSPCPHLTPSLPSPSPPSQLQPPDQNGIMYADGCLGMCYYSSWHSFANIVFAANLLAAARPGSKFFARSWSQSTHVFDFDVVSWVISWSWEPWPEWLACGNTRILWASLGYLKCHSFFPSEVSTKVHPSVLSHRFYYLHGESLEGTHQCTLLSCMGHVELERLPRLFRFLIISSAFDFHWGYLWESKCAKCEPKCITNSTRSSFWDKFSFFTLEGTFRASSLVFESSWPTS